MSEWKVLESVTSPICPIISAHTVKWANKFVECVKEKCMWWDKCKDLEETRPHGEWIEILPFSTGKCSLCGNVANITNFCPNCGARMKEGEAG